MNTTQHRTQLFLDSDRYHWLKQKAINTNISIAHIVREAIDSLRTLDEQSTKKQKAKAYTQLISLLGKGKHGPRSVSLQHDRFLARDRYSKLQKARV